MSSKAKKQFITLRQKARRLLETATDRRLRPLKYYEIEPSLHAGLASLVSAWENYIEAVALEFITCLIDPAQPQKTAIVQLLQLEAKSITSKFNTPNSENSRNLVMRCTGFDPYTFMQSPRLGLNVIQTTARLNEILKVRHSFAHGFSIPNFPWLTRYGHNANLSKKIVQDVDRLISDLVNNIDINIEIHLFNTFGTKF